MKRRTKILLAACVLSALAGGVTLHRVRALSTIPRPFDAHLLEADVIVFATVSRITASSLQEGTFDIELTDENVVSSRFETAEGLRFRVRGMRVDGVLRVGNFHGKFQEGSRHLFFLQGGGVTISPFGPAGLGIWNVDDASQVLCNGGEIYGISPEGLVCSNRSQQFGEPLTEAELAPLLATSLAHARIRWPEAEAELSVDVPPLATWLTDR